MPNRRTGRKRARASVTSLAKRLRSLQLESKFTYPRGRFDPPRVAASPRWPFVLQTTVIQDAAGTATYTDANIRNVVRTTFGWPTDYTSFHLYYCGVDLWTQPTDTVSGANILAMRPYDLISQVTQPWIEDAGTQARPGHLHFRWPRSQSNVALVSGLMKLFDIDSPAQFTATMHVHLMVCCNGGDLIPTSYRRPVLEPSTFVLKDVPRPLGLEVVH